MIIFIAVSHFDGGFVVVSKAMGIAGDICVYTNGNLTVETIKQ